MKMKRSKTELHELHHSYLIQQLEKPLPLNGLFKDNPFNFGGGYKNGGLSDEAMDLLRDIWAFRYMGASEYEWGAVPEALSKIAGYANAGTLTRALVSGPADSSIYVICQEEHAAEISDRIRRWASGDEKGLRDRTFLSDALDPARDGRACGWLELDNGFLFFTDAEMFEKACYLFGLEVE